MTKTIRSLLASLAFSTLIFFISCTEEEDGGSSVDVSVSTTTPTDITGTSATLGGSISGEGVFSTGVVISQTDNPDIENGISVPSTTTSGSFTVSATGLSSSSAYFVRAYAITETEVVYGDTKSFTTLEVDNTAPTLVSISPNGTGTPVSINTTVTFTFSEPMDVTTFIPPGGSVSNNVYWSGGLYGGDVPFTISANGNDIILTPTEELKGGEQYYSYGFFADDITDLAGNSLDIEIGEGDGSFVTVNTPLTITSISPSDDATNVDLNSNIVVTFSNILDPNFVDEEAFTLGSVSGTVTVSGNTVTFDPDVELDDFMSNYNFYVDGYGTLQIRDEDGNYFVNDAAYSFVTEAFSENYYYEFDGNYGYAADNLDITYNGGTSYTVSVSTGSAYESMSWRFVRVDYNGMDVYAITNKIIDNNGHDIYIEAGAADDDSKILTSGRPSSTGWYTGQLWTVEWSGNNSNGFLLKAVVPNAYLSSIDLDINATIGSPYPYEHEWLVTRRAAYTGN